MRLHTDDAPGYDSFLDIVANIVGILIILVMVVGVRVKNAPVRADVAEHVDTPEESPEPEQTSREQQLAQQLHDALATEQSVRRDALQVSESVQTVRAELQKRYRERQRLAVLVSAAKQEIEKRRSELDAAAQEEFDLRQAVAAARDQLNQIEQDRKQVEAAAARTIRVVSYPTPIGKEVDDHEIHFQLRGGRIAYIPLERLLGLYKQDVLSRVAEVRSGLTDTVGPIEGFRLKYESRLGFAMVEGPHGTERTPTVVLVACVAVPDSPQLGETAEEALAEGSEFRRRIAGLQPGRDTATIWFYPDSFSEFRSIKEELHRMGISVAGWPRTHGEPIGWSPLGSKSQAE